MSFGCRAGFQPAGAQGPAFAKCGAVADLDRDTEALLIHLYPERVGFVESEWVVIDIARGEDSPRFTRREHIAAHVAFGTQLLAGSKDFVECLLPVPHRLAIHLYNDMPDNRRSNSLVGEGKVNVWSIAAVEFEDWPHRRAHLLALHVRGVTRNTQGEESNKGRDDRVVSAGAALLLLVRHGPIISPSQ